MAWLIVEHEGKRAAGVIRSRVIVGRWAWSQVCLADQRVSRIHAWIATDGNGKFFLTDAGSRSGTFVNGRPIAGRVDLRRGDRIRIGPMRLYVAEDEAQAVHADPLDLAERAMPPPSPATGIFFDCSCGAPVWVPWNFAGRIGLCRSCGATLSVPRAPVPILPRETARPAVKAREPAPQCGVCHSPINPLEESTHCPECHTEFHVECWTENRGCSVYGCSQVDALEPPEKPLACEDMEPAEEPSVPIIAGDSAAHWVSSPAGVPWAYALLAASVLGTVLGALTFGGTALLAAGAAGTYLIRARPQRQRGIVILAVAVALVGALAGATVSHYWWMGTK